MITFETGREFFNHIKANLKGDEYFNISTVEEHKELPLCVLAKSELSDSIQKQNYSNYHIAALPQNTPNYF